MTRWVASLALALLFLTSPATAQEVDRAEKAHPATGVDVAPELVGCAHADPTYSTYIVRVDFVVDADGTVVPKSVRGRSLDVYPSGVRHTPAEVVREAEEIAKTCRFKAARIEGDAVSVKWNKRFAFEGDPLPSDLPGR